MKSKQDIEQLIKQIEESNAHVLTGSLATIDINAPRALMQISTESKLQALHWVLGTTYKSKLKGTDS